MKSSSLRVALLALALSMPAVHGQGQRARIDENLLRQLIEQSGEKQPPTPEQQKMAILNELKIDRSPPGILEARLEDARAAKEAIQPLPEKPTPEQEMEHFKQAAAVFRRDVVLGRWLASVTLTWILPLGKSVKTRKRLPSGISLTPRRSQ